MKEKEPRTWFVAYHGDRRVGFAKDAGELYRECLRQGIPDDDFIVRQVAPPPPNVIFNPYWSP